MPIAPLRKYRLKQEFKDLFSNLSKGEALTPRDALRDPTKPSRRSLSDEEIKAKVHDKEQAILEALAKAQFVEVVEEQVDLVERGG